LETALAGVSVEALARELQRRQSELPQLKATAQALRAELAETESRIALARTYYNGMVTSFNGRIATVPDSVLARIGGLKPFAFFEAKGLERDAVVVDFAS
jgi:LemA protein